MKGVLEGFKKVSVTPVSSRAAFCRGRPDVLTCFKSMCTERGGAEEVCTGLPAAHQAGGAAISNFKNPR